MWFPTCYQPFQLAQSGFDCPCYYTCDGDSLLGITVAWFLMLETESAWSILQKFYLQALEYSVDIRFPLTAQVLQRNIGSGQWNVSVHRLLSWSQWQHCFLWLCRCWSSSHARRLWWTGSRPDLSLWYQEGRGKENGGKLLRMTKNSTIMMYLLSSVWVVKYRIHDAGFKLNACIFLLQLSFVRSIAKNVCWRCCCILWYICCLSLLPAERKESLPWFSSQPGRATAGRRSIADQCQTFKAEVEDPFWTE